MKKREVVEVRWLDAWIDFEDVPADEAKKLCPVVRTTIGWLVAEKDDCIVMCTDYYNDDDNYINTPIIIPTGMIESYYKYQVIKEE